MIRKARREWFGALVYNENPGMTVWVDHERADALGIPKRDNRPPLAPGIYSVPLDVHMALTTRCQLRCPGCYAPLEDPGRDIDPDLARRIIRRLSELNVFTLSFGGGEPTLHPELFELAPYARTHRIAANITTNGFSIGASAAKQFQIFTSVHLSYHRDVDLPALTRAAISLAEVGINPGLNLLLTNETFSSLDATLRWARKHRIQRVLFQQFKTSTHNAHCDHLRLAPDQIAALVPQLRKLCRKHRILPLIDCSLFPVMAAAGIPRHDLEFFDLTGCQGGNAYAAIDIDGQLRPCSFWPGPILPAESLDESLWSGHPALIAFRTSQPAACSGCSLADLCSSPCRLPGFAARQDFSRCHRH